MVQTKNNVSDKDDSAKKDAAQKDSEGIGSVFRAKTGLSDYRKTTNYHGVVVSASGTHTLKSLMINGGVAGTGAAVGLGNDSEDITRAVNSEVRGKNIPFENNGDIYVNNLNIESKGRQGITSLVAGISGAGVGAGLSNSTGVYLLDAKTTASSR